MALTNTDLDAIKTAHARAMEETRIPGERCPHAVARELLNTGEVTSDG